MGIGAESANALLSSDEPPPFTLVNPDAGSGLVLVCDHASNRVPRRLKQLGLDGEVLETHIGWDPGAALVARALSDRLDAVLVLSGYSRLVIDCNRPLSSPQLIPEQSAGVVVPGNQGLTSVDRDLRIQSLFVPYQSAISRVLEQHDRPTALLSIHSFTPNLNSEQRPWHIGVAFYRDDRLARALFNELQAPGDLTVGFNQPYSIETDFDYTVPVQGEMRGLPGAMVEIRQDMIGGLAAAEQWAERLARVWASVVASDRHQILQQL